MNNLPTPLTEKDFDFEVSEGYWDVLTKESFLKAINKLQAHYEERFQQLYEICKPKES